VIHLLRLVDAVWHHAHLDLLLGLCDRLALWVHIHVCTPVANWEIGE
jgi:hypothetical protein